MKKLLHGDAVQLLSAIPNRSIDLVLTDPPYGNNAVYGGRKILGDENPLIGLAVLSACYRVLKNNRTCYFFLDVRHLPIIRGFVEQYTSFAFRDVLVWDKVHIGFGDRFRRRHEHILVLEKGRPAYRNRGLPNVLAARRIVSTRHPHEKPVSLLRSLIEHSTDNGGVVLDPFMGSGSAGEAALSARRSFIGMELSDEFYRVACQRLEDEADTADSAFISS